MVNFKTNYGEFGIYVDGILEKKKTTAQILGQFFADGKYEERVYDNQQIFNLEGLLGRLTSSSYCPKEGTPNYEPLMKEITKLFEEFQENGVVSFQYSTRVYYGKV